jgi:hypothetical protein
MGFAVVHIQDLTVLFSADCESCRKKMIGKPYSGKLNVRFDEGELETPDRYSPK